jgi:hypothetical protein
MQVKITENSILKSGDLFQHNNGGVYMLQKLPDFEAWSLIMMGHINKDGSYNYWMRPTNTAFKAFGNCENDFARTSI